MSPPRGSASPCRSPATLKDWQGVPPTKRSTVPGSSVHSLCLVMSPKFGTFGKRCASTADGKGSISLNPTGVQPNRCHATDAASMPEQTDRYFISNIYRDRNSAMPCNHSKRNLIVCSNGSWRRRRSNLLRARGCRARNLSRNRRLLNWARISLLLLATFLLWLKA